MAFFAVQGVKADGKLYDIAHTGNGPDSAHNAMIIQRAVNYHERLIEALRDMAELDDCTSFNLYIAAVNNAGELLAELDKEQAQ